MPVARDRLAYVGTSTNGLCAYVKWGSTPWSIPLSPAEAEVYKQELRKKIRVLLSKAITVYERTLEAAERIGAQSPFVEKTRESLKRMKEQLLTDAKAEEDEPRPPPGRKVPHS